MSTMHLLGEKNKMGENRYSLRRKGEEDGRPYYVMCDLVRHLVTYLRIYIC